MAATYHDFTREPSKPHQCMHFSEKGGTRCHSFAMQNEYMCYQHRSDSIPTVIENDPFLIERLDDRASIQKALADVAARLACNRMDLRRAGLLLYTLQIASANLPPHPRIAAEPTPQSATNNQQTQSGLADQDAGREHQAAANDHLQAAQGEAGLEVLVADQGDNNEFHADDAVSPCKRLMHVREKKRQRMQEPADKRHQAGNDAAEDGVAATGEFAVVGESLGEGHGDACADGGRCADKEDGPRVVSGECGGEDGREGGDRSVHEAREARLDDAQDEALVVVDEGGEFLDVRQRTGHRL